MKRSILLYYAVSAGDSPCIGAKTNVILSLGGLQMNLRDTGRLEETKRHGSVLFPFNIYPCTIPGDFPSVSLHWHRSMEIIYIKKGRGQVRLGAETLAAEAGDAFVVPPGTLHGIRSVPEERMDYENIIFEPDFLGAGAADACAVQYLVPLAAGQLLRPLCLQPGQPGYEAAADCLSRAEDLCREKAPGYELGVKAAMLQLVFLLLRQQPAPPAVEKRSTQRLKRVLQRVERDYARPLTVAQAAEECGCSASHFMRWFRRATGSSFVAYLNEYRLAAAASRLRETDDKILTVAQETGFESLSNFNRQFRLRYGMSPREYRDTH